MTSVGSTLRNAARGLHAVAREVHERPGLEQRDGIARAARPISPFVQTPLNFSLKSGHPVRAREMVDDHEADVVPVLLVLLARISEPDDEVHGGASDADRKA